MIYLNSTGDRGVKHSHIHTRRCGACVDEGFECLLRIEKKIRTRMEDLKRKERNNFLEMAVFHAKMYLRHERAVVCSLRIHDVSP